MSSHFQSSHAASSHYESSHYGRTLVVAIVPKGGLMDGWEIVGGRRRRREEEEFVALLVAVVEAIERDRTE